MEALIGDILSKWCEMKEFVKIDTAYCNINLRVSLLNIYQNNCKITLTYNGSNNVEWVMIRQIIVNKLKITFKMNEMDLFHLNNNVNKQHITAIQVCESDLKLSATQLASLTNSCPSLNSVSFQDTNGYKNIAEAASKVYFAL